MIGYRQGCLFWVCIVHTYVYILFVLIACIFKYFCKNQQSTFCLITLSDPFNLKSVCLLFGTVWTFPDYSRLNKAITVGPNLNRSIYYCKRWDLRSGCFRISISKWDLIDRPHFENDWMYFFFILNDCFGRRCMKCLRLTQRLLSREMREDIGMRELSCLPFEHWTLNNLRI